MATDILLDTSSPVITVNQATLLFKINENYLSSQKNTAPKNVLIPISQTEIIITNITSNYVAYRTRITRKKYYAVEPSHLILCPNSNIKVNITYYFNPDDKFPPEHKFRFEGIIIPNNMKNKDPREIFDDFAINKREVKGNSIKKNAEFIFDDNYEYNPPSVDNIRLNSSQTLNSVISESNSSIYSNALGKSMERPSRISLRNKNKTGKLRSQKEVETIDPIKLKNEYDKLKNEYDNNVKELDIIKRKINNINGKNKYRYIVPDINYSSLNTKIIVILFGTAFFLGFYLTK